MKHNLLKSLIISVILLTGVSNAWGDDTRQFLIGDATGGNWIENKFTYPVDSYYGQDNKCCIYVWMQNGQHFAFCNYTGSQYGPASDKQEIKNGDSSQEGNYEDGKNYAWKYTGNTGLVRICVDYSYKGNVWRPCVWVEELTEVMKGSEIMFYFGNTWGWNNSSGTNEQYLRTANNTNSSNIQFVGQAGFEKLDSKQTYSTCCKVPTGNYYISNNSTWPGIPIGANAEAGAMYSLTNNGSDIINKIASVKPTWGSNQTLFEVYKGTEQSGIAATCDNSVIKKPNTIYYCYTQDNQNFHRFNPDDVSNLPLGTYTVWAIACDGHIAVKSATSVELRIKDYTVTLAGTDYGTYTVKCGEQTITVSNQTRTITDVAAGTQLTITNIQPNAGYDQTMIYSAGKYTEFDNYEVDNQGNRTYTYTVTSDVTIAEDFRTKEAHTIFVKVPKGNASAYWEGLRIIPMNGVTQSKAETDASVNKFAEPMKEWQNIDEYILYYFTIPAGNHSFKLYPANNTTASNSFWYEILPKDGTKDINQNCWVIDNKESNTNADGTWVASKVYLDPCNIGTYGIKYNGEEYLNYATTSREIEMPYGSSIQIIDATPTSPHYMANPRYETSVVKYTTDNIINSASEIKQNEIINVSGDNLKFAPNLVTKNTHRVFLHIPKDLKQIWGEVDNETNFNTIYLMDYLSYWRIALPTNPNPNFPYGRLEKMSALETFAADEDEYYYIDIPEGYHTFVFERKHKDALVQYGQPWIKSIILHYGIPTDENNNCFTIIDETGDENRQKGTWGPAPTYTVTLGYCEFGRYGVVYDGKTYYSKDRSDVVIENVPLGTELQILPGEPASDKYDGKLTYEITKNDKKVKDNLESSTYTVTQDVTIDDNFVTNVDIPVYLGIPTALTDWTPGENNMEKDDMALYVWRTDSYNDGSTFGLTNVDLGSSLYEKDGIAYYQFTLGKGCNDFQFQLKNLKNREGTNGQNNGTTYRKSQWHRFQIPLTDVNCFVLDVNNYGSDNSKEYTGYWTRLPQQEEGDYRLRYIEQTLTLVDGHPHTEEVYSHCSDVIKANDPEEKRTLYSLHIFNEMDEEKTYGGEIIQGLNNPAIVVEKWDGSQWVEQMRHMVFGPLRGDFSLAAMPGRRNESPIDPYDDGIENIKNDLKNIEAYSNSGTSFYIGKDNPEETDYKRYIENWGNDNCSGVWNFVVNRDDAGNINTQDPLLLEKTHRYDGEYYIRSTAAIGGWSDYTAGYNDMTRTNISKTNSNFSHYFCKWLTKNVNVRYVIANDYNLAISDDLKADETTLMGDPIGDDLMVSDDEKLPKNANVRFSWNEKTNFLHRAYLAGSTHVQDRFLVLRGKGDDKLFNKDGNDLKAGEDTGSDPRYGLNANEEIFQDISNWIYYTDVQVKPLAQVKITAKYNEKEQYFVGTADEWNKTLLQGTGEKKYLIRVLYDFKTNQMTSAYVPDRKENEDIEPIQTNLMLIRREEPDDKDSKVTQLVFNTKAMDNSNTRAYGVLELSKDRLVNDGKYNDLRRRLYWISFPFDVQIADVFGSCVYGQHWIIQSYNGQKRADNGYYYETTESNWEYHFDPNTINEGDPIYEGVLKKGVGYVVALNLYNIWKDQLLENTKDAICLYFPSKDLISADIVKDQNITIEVPGHKCEKKGREVADSHWNVIGVPAYKNAGVNFTQEIDLSTDFAYYYRWDKAHNAYTPMANFGKKDDEKFSTLHAYMVQYHGGLKWTGVLRESNQQFLAARKDVDNQKEYNLRLEVQKNGTELDRTFVKLQEDDVTALFDFNYDLCKITNAGANIYSFTSDATPIKVAGNVQPLAEDIVIPVGVVIDQAGDYTFSMPDGTAGIEVQLIDYQTNEKTNLLFGDYTINLPKGTFDNRFALLINPDKTATSVENINGNTENGANGEGVKKYIIDGQLYLQQGSALYDAQGHTVR